MGFWFGNSSGGGLLVSCGSIVLHTLELFTFDFLFVFDDVAEDIIQDKVAVRLLGQNESLRKFALRLLLGRHFANDLDDNVLPRALGIDIRDADFAVLNIQLFDALIDCLRVAISSKLLIRYISAYLLTNTHVESLGFRAGDELGTFVVEELGDLSIRDGVLQHNNKLTYSFSGLLLMVV